MSATTIQPKIKIKKLAKKDGDEALQEAPIEEHFVLRLPPALANSLREPIRNRALPTDLSIQFKDSRHGKFTINGKSLNCTLIDLPCITESLKTIDNKQFYKIADVSQMLVVHPGKYQGEKDYSTPDGLTYPLRNVRNARFRKRMNKKLIEDVEQEVERLLAADLDAEDVHYEVHERKEIGSEEEESEAEASDEGDEFDLGAAIEEMDKEEVVEEEHAEQEDDSESEESDDSIDEAQSDANEDNELEIKKKALRNEISTLEQKLAEKNQLVNNQVNAIMKERFQGIVDKLVSEINLKKDSLKKLSEEVQKEDLDEDEDL